MSQKKNIPFTPVGRCATYQEHWWHLNYTYTQVESHFSHMFNNKLVHHFIGSTWILVELMSRSTFGISKTIHLVDFRDVRVNCIESRSWMHNLSQSRLKLDFWGGKSFPILVEGWFRRYCFYFHQILIIGVQLLSIRIEHRFQKHNVSFFC